MTLNRWIDSPLQCQWFSIPTGSHSNGCTVGCEGEKYEEKEEMEFEWKYEL